jgi:hypothetical protein
MAYVLKATAGEIVYNDDLIVGGEYLGDVGADEAGSPCHYNPLAFHFTATSAVVDIMAE